MMNNIIPRAQGQKITYADVARFPEKQTELFDGNFEFMENEKKALLLAYLTNFGLEYIVGILPSESVEELKEVLAKINEDKSL